MVITIIVLLLVGLLFLTWRVAGNSEAEQFAESPSPNNDAVMQSAAKNAEVHARNHKDMGRMATGLVRARMKTLPYHESKYPALSAGGDVIDVEAVDVV